VSHNPDIECYADRIFYISDGTFVEQAINVEQTRLIYSEYIQYVNRYQQSNLQEDDEENDTI
jgi:putative ABC transport system ATP-binding protein